MTFPKKKLSCLSIFTSLLDQLIHNISFYFLFILHFVINKTVFNIKKEFVFE